MRPDMSKLLVERGHAGTGWNRSRPKGWAKRCRFRNEEDEPLEAWVDPIRQPAFSENLAPLRRYLAAQVGRPWNSVYSEIRANVDAGNAVQYHILQHLYHFIAVQTRCEAEGRISCQRSWGGFRLIPEGGLYVCPHSGLIRRVRHCSTQYVKRSCQDRIPASGPDHEYRLIGGQWYECHWGANADGERAIIRKRQISRHEKRALGVAN